jgi:hypothetical protein
VEGPREGAGTGAGLHFDKFLIQPSAGETTGEQLSEVNVQLRRMARGGVFR